MITSSHPYHHTAEVSYIDKAAARLRPRLITIHTTYNNGQLMKLNKRRKCKIWDQLSLHIDMHSFYENVIRNSLLSMTFTNKIYRKVPSYYINPMEIINNKFHHDPKKNNLRNNEISHNLQATRFKSKTKTFVQSRIYFRQLKP